MSKSLLEMSDAEAIAYIDELRAGRQHASQQKIIGKIKEAQVAEVKRQAKTQKDEAANILASFLTNDKEK